MDKGSATVAGQTYTAVSRHRVFTTQADASGEQALVSAASMATQTPPVTFPSACGMERC
jgi:hypothetical protein